MDETLLQLELEPLVNARRERIGDREYVVASAVILKEQVLAGSDGPLFYPLDEINQDVGVWNGYPLTANHPQVVLPDGTVVNASARSPKVAHAYQIGTVYNDRMEGGVRKVDAWFDVKDSNRIDNRLVPAVLAGKSINVSTGLFTGKVQNSGSHAGRSYTHKVRGIKPDHLAVLMDVSGACSVGDGCGINVNAESEMNDDDCIVNVEGVCVNCGGPGGKPGPCPSGVGAPGQTRAARHAEALAAGWKHDRLQTCTVTRAPLESIVCRT
jgi:hypothetical protein